jgi:hypothetical protein
VIRFRRSGLNDLPLISEWIAADPPHANIKPEFFTEDVRNVSCYAIEDDAGVTMFVRQEACGQDVRLHTQFSPDAKRVAKALEEAYPLVAEDARERGFRSIRFESGSIALVRFMFKRFDFRADLMADL